jgi:hypothetical protein
MSKKEEIMPVLNYQLLKSKTGITLYFENTQLGCFNLNTKASSAQFLIASLVRAWTIYLLVLSAIAMAMSIKT